ncbi:MAG TPA: Mur ligase family protein [Oligoflexia bacterium]|nr:Mur ligase family protein [Oligoflexia bacterium]HMR25377.1 Mur ligase family protein [Oligoflexia bacterium]
MQTNNKTLAWLEQKTESRFVFGLERMHAALDFFNIKDTSTHVQILGTNGKGSTIEFLKDILMHHHKKVAVYTSPHLFSLYDRFKINNESISEDLFLNYLSRLFDAEKNQLIPELSYFEITTLLAYLYFSEQNVDYMLIEAGLGGRLDATTALPYSHVLFTSIDYDHQAYLGDSLQSIAYEKFSVIQSHHQVFSLDQDTEALHELKKIIQQTKATLYLENQDFFLSNHNHLISFILTNNFHIKTIELSLHGEHQFHNALLATQAAKVLLNNAFNSKTVKQSLKKTLNPGRYQKIIQDQTTFIFDVAHNLQSFTSLMKTSKNDDPDIDVYCLSMLDDKPWQLILSELIQYKKPIVLCMTESLRAWKQEHVLDWIKHNDHDHLIQFYKDFKHGLDYIQNHYKKCLIFGSFFFVGPCIEYLDSK